MWVVGVLNKQTITSARHICRRTSQSPNYNLLFSLNNNTYLKLCIPFVYPRHIHVRHTSPSPLSGIVLAFFYNLISSLCFSFLCFSFSVMSDVGMDSDPKHRCFSTLSSCIIETRTIKTKLGFNLTYSNMKFAHRNENNKN